METSNEDKNPGEDRSQIAKYVLIGSTGLLALYSLSFLFIKPTGDTAEKIFTTMIPVVSTWVGTVLAFYFSGENFKKANESVSKLIGQVVDEKLKNIKVEEVMIPFSSMVKVTLTQADPKGSTLNLEKNMLSLLDERITRIPVLDHNNIGKYIFHESALYRFFHSSEGNTPDKNNLTLADILNNQQLSDFASKTIAYVNKNATHF